MTASSASPDVTAVRAYSRCSASSSVSSSSSSMPMTPFSGVRSSWLMLARKSDFAREASIARRSASRRSVMSVPAATMCVDLAVGADQAVVAPGDQPPLAVLVEPLDLELDREVRRLGVTEACLDGLDVLGRERELGGCETADLVLEAAGEQLARAVEALDPPLGVEDHDQAAGGVDHGRREVALGLDGGLRAQALGDVGRHAEEARDLAVVVALGA